MKNAKTIPQILWSRMHLAIQVLLTLTCSKTHLQFFWISQNDFEWSRKINKYCYNKQSASGINPMEYKLSTCFRTCHTKCAVNSYDSWLQVWSSLFSYGTNLLSSDHWNKNWKNHKHIFSTSSAAENSNFLGNTRPKTADLHAQCWKNLSLQAFLWASGRWAFNRRPGHFCMHMALATVWGSGQVTFKNIGTKFRTQSKLEVTTTWVIRLKNDTCNAYEWLKQYNLGFTKTNNSDFLFHIKFKKT